MPTPLPRPASGQPFAKDWQSFKPAAPEFDVAVIGGGSAGFAAARTASGLGARAVVIEGGERVGGLCILRGCMPSKSLLESAHRWHDIRRAREFGLVAKAVEVDMKCVQARKQYLVGASPPTGAGNCARENSRCCAALPRFSMRRRCS